MAEATFRGDEDEPASKKPKHMQSLHDREQEKRLIVILEKASLETIKVGKTYELLNCDKHKHLMKKYKREASQCRPDITHQCLLMLLDSPLNRAGLLQVYIHTDRNVLIEVNPQTRIPRTFDRFCGLMVQLLQKLSIRAADGNKKLLKVIKNPISDHLPTACTRLGTSFKTDTVYNPRALVPSNEPIVIAVGAFAHGTVDLDYVERSVSISNFPLSAALTCSKMTSAFEEVWKVDKVDVQPTSEAASTSSDPPT